MNYMEDCTCVGIHYFAIGHDHMHVILSIANVESKFECYLCAYRLNHLSSCIIDQCMHDLLNVDTSDTIYANMYNYTNIFYYILIYSTIYTNIQNIIYNKFQYITHCCWCMYNYIL